MRFRVPKPGTLMVSVRNFCLVFFASQTMPVHKASGFRVKTLGQIMPISGLDHEASAEEAFKDRPHL